VCIYVLFPLEMNMSLIFIAYLFPISVISKVSIIYIFNMKRLYMEYAVVATFPFYFQAADILNNPTEEHWDSCVAGGAIYVYVPPCYPILPCRCSTSPRHLQTTPLFHYFNQHFPQTPSPCRTLGRDSFNYFHGV
jgi:hypothetical protein